MSKSIIYGVFSAVTKKISRYDRIVSQEKKEESVYFAVSTIIGAIFTVAFSFLLSIAIASVIDKQVNDGDGYVMRWITFGGGLVLNLILALLSGACSIVLIFNNLLNVFFQFRLNKKVIGFIALGLFIVSIVLSILFIYLCLK